jgi:hypothetical protein
MNLFLFLAAAARPPRGTVGVAQCPRVAPTEHERLTRSVTR